MRTRQSLINAIFSLVGQFIIMLINFYSRRVFITYLGTSLLGLNGLYTDILNLLSIAEMGFISVMIFSLYKPLAERDYDKISAYMKVFSKIYITVGIIVFFAGLAVTPFLSLLVETDQINLSVYDLSMYFLFYLAGSAVSYLFSHKRALIIADQQRYVISLLNYSSLIIMNVIQILVLIYTKNFALFLLVRMIMVIIENFSVGIVVRKKYRFLSTKSGGNELTNDEKKDIAKNVKIVFIHRLAGIVVGSVSIMLTILVGIEFVGKYSNYVLILTAFNMFLIHFFDSVTASVGNLNVENPQANVNIFNSLFFINALLVGVFSVNLAALFNPFISWWVGSELLINESVVLTIVGYFFISGMRKSVLVFRDAMGLFWEDRHKPFIEVGASLILPIILSFWFGELGIFAGFIIASLLTGVWMEPYVVFTHGLQAKMSSYFKRFALYVIAIGFLYFVVINVNGLISVPGLFGLMIKGVIGVTITGVGFLLFFSWTKEIRYLLGMAKRIIFKKKN